MRLTEIDASMDVAASGGPRLFARAHPQGPLIVRGDVRIEDGSGHGGPDRRDRCAVSLRSLADPAAV